MAIIHVIRTPATPEQIADMLQAFGDFINIRPNQNNPSMTILDPVIRDQVERIVRRLLEKP
jgi:hypothetical protein